MSLTFDKIIEHERSRRDASRSAQALARRAKWAVLIASVLGSLLAFGALVATIRKLGSANGGAAITRSRNELVAAGTELRAPLESIIAESSQLRLSTQQPAHLRILENIARNASRVNAMLAELLDVTAMQTGATSLRRESCDAAMLVDWAVKDHRDAAWKRGVRLRYEAQLSISVYADRERIRHVLDSLLQIAIGSARQGAELAVLVAAGEGGVRFAIVEAGPGTDGAPSNELALHLCSRVVEAHGGRFGVQTSSISRTYWFSLPTEPSLLR